MLLLVGCLYYLYQWCTVKQMSDNEIYLLIKYIKSVLWRAAKRLSYIQDARFLKVKAQNKSENWFGEEMEWHCKSNGASKGVGLENSLRVTPSFRFNILAVVAMLKFSMVLRKLSAKVMDCYLKVGRSCTLILSSIHFKWEYFWVKFV